jgi:putative proteasome-type protease
VRPDLTLDEGARLCLVSLDATTRSNITVGPPFEVATYIKDAMNLSCRCTFEEADPYLMSLRKSWNDGINEVFRKLPSMVWSPQQQQLSLQQNLVQPKQQQQQQVQQPFNTQAGCQIIGGNGIV